MNNTKRKILAGVIAAVVCFTMIMGSFGAIIGAVFGLISNQDLIDAINNGSISVGDLALLASLTEGSYKIDGKDVTNVALDGYHEDLNRKNLDEISDKKDDYDTYNKPFYPATPYANGTEQSIELKDTASGTKYTKTYNVYTAEVSNDFITENINGKLVYCTIGIRVGVYSETGEGQTLDITSDTVIAMGSADDIVNGPYATENRIVLKRPVFADGLLDKGIDINGNIVDTSAEKIYGICIHRSYFNIAKGATLTLLGRDFNGNGYIDDVPVEITVNGTDYWFYEKIVLSGSSAFQDYDVMDDSTIAGQYNANKGGMELVNLKDGVTRPLISVYGGPKNTTCKLIISGADLRNNLNETIPDLTGKTSANIAEVDDVKAGGGAIYLASGSKDGAGRNETTCGYFSEVVITNTRFAYCGAVRGGAIMVGKNFFSPTLDLSYCDFNHCYTTYFNYVGVTDDHKEGDQSGDGGAICFYQDESLTEDWDAVKDHNNPSLVYVGTADFTGASFRFCYAMRAGGAISFGGYHYDNDDFTPDDKGHVTKNLGAAAETLGTRIEKLMLDFCDFYCCGAGWAMYGDPIDSSGRALVDSDFIFTKNFVADIVNGNRFYAVKNALGITDIPANADVDASENLNHNNGGTGSYLFKEAHMYSNTTALASFNWYRGYDTFAGGGETAEDLQNASTKYDNYTTQRGYNNWYNIPQLKFAEGSREGGALFFNCRVKEMSMKDSTFVYCATDSNGSAVFLADYFVCPKATVENCLFKNCLATQSFNGNGTEGGTFRSRGLVAADIHFNNCSFLYNSNMSGAGALYMNLNHTYTGPNGDTEYNVYAPDNEEANGTAKRNGDRCAGTEVNNCVFFGNFSFWKGAAIKCSGVMDINSSTFAYNMVNAGSGGAIKFETYIRTGVNVGTSKAHMRFDINYNDPNTLFDGHTIVCNNAAGGNGDSNGGGGISINADHSGSVGTPNTTVTSGSLKSNEYSFDFQLNGVLVFDNTAAGGGGGILYRVKSSEAPADTTANAWLYNKSVILNDGYIFNNIAYASTVGGGGVRVRDNVSVLEGSTQVNISGAYIYNNKADTSYGGGLYILAEGGTVNITGGYVIGNTAPNGAGIYIKDTNAVNITGGHVGINKYGAPTLTVTKDDTTFPDAASATLAGGNVATGNGGGIFIENSFTDETYFDNDTTVTMTGGIIEANEAGTGGGLYMVRGSVTNAGIVNFTMNQSSDNSAYGFYGNTATGNGAGIYAASDNKTDPAQRYVVNLNGGEVAANVAAENGGGAFITGGAKLVVDGGTMDSNVANTKNGGAVYINSEDAEAFISNGQISNNYAAQHGGGIQAFDANLTVSGGNITKNESGTAGGGLAIRGSALLTMDGGTVSANTSVSGGGVFVSGASAVATIEGGTIGAGNNATTNGGGIYANDSATVTMKGGKVDGNTAANNGGGICISDTNNFKMEGGAISNNVATNGNGGGVYTDSPALATSGLPKDNKTSLLVGVWLQPKSAGDWIGDKYGDIESQFKAHLANLDFEVKDLDIQFKTFGNNEANATTFKTFIETYPNVDVIVGGGGNIYTSWLKDYGYDQWYTSADDTNNNAKINTAYTQAGGSRTVAMVTKNGSNTVQFDKTSHLAQLFYRFVLDSSMTNHWSKLSDTEKDALMPNTATSSAATLESGNITGNKALNGYGGGVCCDSSIVNLTAKDNSSYPVIQSNTAKNGGGVAVINGGSVTMQGGYVTDNTAKCVDANYVNTNTTSYQRHSDLEGVGGGIYVANELGSSATTSSFSIKDYNNFNSGIYLNNAEFAADDVFANAVKTQLSVPAFKSMKIIGNAGNPTGWFEDYAKNDTNYTIGLNGINTRTDPILRYDYAVANGKDVFESWIDSADKTTNGASNTISKPTKYINAENTFVCVTLGAYVIYDGQLTITKRIDNVDNVDPEQTFIFHVVRTLDGNGNALAAGSADAVDMYVTINVVNGTSSSVTITSLPLGTYEVTEMTEWSWRYKVVNEKGEDASKSITGILQKSDGDTKDLDVTFINTLNSDKWLDGNSPKVVNSLNSSSKIDISYIGGENTTTVAYVNFKREETLI